MMKIGLLFLTSLFFSTLFAQDSASNVIITAPVTMKMPKSGVDLVNRPGDHLMIQVAYNGWTPMPDSISSHQSGISRGLNIYLMTDKPFKGNPHYSIGLGIGVGSSNIFFKRAMVDVKSANTKLPFTKLDSSNHFKKYKVSESFLEVPFEFRYSSHPETPAKSFKLAVGFKAGTLINVHTKGKDLQDKNNNTVNSYTEKQSSKKFFNSTRFAGTLRVGYGILSLYGSYGLNNVLKDAAGAPFKLYEIGINLSGL